MELMFDNANLETLTEFAEIYPYVGVTSNPTIIKEEGKIDFFEHFKKVRELVGENRSLHIQVVSSTAEGMIAEAQKIVEKMFSMDRVLEIKKNQLFKFEELIKSQFVKEVIIWN